MIYAVILIPLGALAVALAVVAALVLRQEDTTPGPAPEATDSPVPAPGAVSQPPACITDDSAPIPAAADIRGRGHWGPRKGEA